MIIDLPKFIREESLHWKKLEKILDRMAQTTQRRMGLEEVREFHQLYQRASGDLAKLSTFSTEPETRRYLESLVARAYAETHEAGRKAGNFKLINWFMNTFPQTFRRCAAAFWLSVAITAAGVAFGGAAIVFDQEAKEVLMPFSHLAGDPSERVASEESAEKDRLRGQKAAFSGQLMTHNSRVSIFTMGLGITWGIGTVIMLFYNGAILGAVALDYIMAGEIRFLFGWLMPHGAIEIPAILLAGQAGLVLASALIGWGDHSPLAERLRKSAPDLATLISGVMIMLAWAGFVEAFLSQYHEPLIPYSLKISFGAVEMGLLAAFLSLSGRTKAGESRGEA